MKCWNKTIAVAMSGGVDSSVSAWILKKLNYKIFGVFMINWVDEENCYKNDLKYILWISKILNIEIKIVNFFKIYKKKIFLKLIKNYKLNLIPNPDIWCNKYIKFKILIKYILLKGAKILATGHYAKICKKKKFFFLKNSKDKNKDQTYFLCRLNKKKFKKILFPIGNIYKNDVKNLAFKIGFPNYKKKSSKGICFIQKKSFILFIKKYIFQKIGYILDINKNIISLHIGNKFFTLNQRKNICINNNILYIKFKKKNIIYMEKFFNYKIILIIYKLFLNYNKLKNFKYIKIKIRHSKNYLLSFVKYINKDKIILIINKIYCLITPGQPVVFYIKNICLGSGIIYKCFNL